MISRISVIVSLFLYFGSLVSGQTIDHWETAVYNNDTWKYKVGTSEPDTEWRSLDFNDTDWAQGPGGFGYSDNDDNTVIPQCISVYIRHKFNLTDTAVIAKAILSMDYDDAFVAYINDTEIARSGISGTHPAYNQTGTDHEASMYSGGLPESFIIEKTLLKDCLLSGENVLAVQVHNSSPTSSDMSSNVFLSLGILDASSNYRPAPDWFNPPFDFTSSNLPIVIIDTRPGEKIKNEPKITAEMKIIDNSAQGFRNNIADSGNVYTGFAGIEIRGKYSASLPQKPYGFETRDEAGNNLNVSLLGMPEENDWVLLANYNDKSFLRNVLANNIFHKMGNYAPRLRYCELVLNGEYQGIYLLGEKIKEDSGRVNISKLKPEDNSGDQLTGGYIIKNDYFTANDSWKSNFPPMIKRDADVFFVYYDPKPDVLTIQQKEYIQGFIDRLETVLYHPFFNIPVFGYKSYIDINSFADYFIIGEVSRNVDAYKKSRFYYKDRDSKGGLLHSGPVWDFDWAWRNLKEGCIHFKKTDGSGWAYRINDCNPSPVPPSWEVRMLQDNEFAELIHNRYYDLRNSILSRQAIEKTIDSVAVLLDEAQNRHFQKWKILGINAGTPEPDPQPTTYSGEIEKLKTWINLRLYWLDANMVGPSVPGDNNINSGQVNYRVFPNPAIDKVFIESDHEIESVSITDMRGSTVIKITDCRSNSVPADLSHMGQGVYLVKIVLKSGDILKSRLVKL